MIDGKITQSNHKTFLVDSKLCTCTCGHSQSNGIGCGHVFSFISTLQTHLPPHPTPCDYIPYCFFLLGLRHTHTQNISSISLPKFELAAEIVVPKEKGARGLFKVNRYTNGKQRK